MYTAFVYNVKLTLPRNNQLLKYEWTNEDCWTKNAFANVNNNKVTRPRIRSVYIVGYWWPPYHGRYYRRITIQERRNWFPTFSNMTSSCYILSRNRPRGLKLEVVYRWKMFKWQRENEQVPGAIPGGYIGRRRRGNYILPVIRYYAF